MEARLPCITFAVTLVCTGCATVSPNTAPNSAPKPTAAHATTERGAGEELIPDDAALAAVENFLARTRDYQPGETAAPSGTAARAATDRQSPPSGMSPAASTGVAEADSAKPATPIAPQAIAVANAGVEISPDAPTAPSSSVPTVQRVAIRPTPGAGDLTPKPAANTESATNQPLALNGGTVTPSTEEAVLAGVKSQLAGATDFDSAWRWATVRSAIGGDNDDAPHLSQEARNAHARLTALGDAVRDAFRDAFGPTGGALEELEGLREALVERSDPAIGTIALCRKVVTFGVYEPLPETELVGGRAVAAIVYVEIGNLRTESVADGGFRSALRTRLELFTEAGASVWNREEPQIEDVCRRRRRDFFIAQRVTLPATITSGEYVLKVYVEDRLSGRATESSQPLSIGGATALVRAAKATE